MLKNKTTELNGSPISVLWNNSLDIADIQSIFLVIMIISNWGLKNAVLF